MARIQSLTRRQILLVVVFSMTCGLITLSHVELNAQNSGGGAGYNLPARIPLPEPAVRGTTDAADGSIAVNENALYNTYTPAQLVQNILITGCLTASNVTFTGAFSTTNVNNRQLGYFSKATSTFPISEGLIMSSGYVTEAEGPNNSTQAGANLNRTGDADLTTLAGYPTYDAAVLQFDFVPAGDSVQFQYIFASEEYPEFTCTQYNDVFGFFLSGPYISGPYSNNATVS